MQTFLPYADFNRSAEALDNARLGNQCYRECVTLYRGGWPNHPAAKMWRDHPHELARYGLACAIEMQHRYWAGTGPWSGATCNKWIHFWLTETHRTEPQASPVPWLGDSQLHSSHRACLLAKDPTHYGQHGWVEQAASPDPKTGKLPYHWPVK